LASALCEVCRSRGRNLQAGGFGAIVICGIAQPGVVTEFPLLHLEIEGHIGVNAVFEVAVHGQVFPS